MLSSWLTHEAAVLSLEMIRIAGLLLAGPMAWAFLPMRARAGLVFLLAVIIHQPGEAQDLRAYGPVDFFLSAASELGVGASIGFIARLVIAVGEVASDAIAPIMGLGAAQMFDPALGGQGTVLTRILRYVGLWIALGVGLHHMLLGAVFQSFYLLPTGSVVGPGVLAPQMLHLVSTVLVAGIKLALPFMAVLFITQVGLAFIARAAPAMQIFAVGFAVTLGIGFLLWMVFAPDLVRELALLAAWGEQNIELCLRTLKGGE